MLGLMKKDILVMKHQFHIRDIFVVGCMAAFLFFGTKKYAMIILSAILLIMVSGYCNTIAMCDARTRWDEYESILPISRKKRVLSRYLVCIGMLLLLLIGLLLLNFILSFSSMGMKNYLLLAEFYAVYFQMLIAIPISLKKGGEKSSYVMCAFLLILAIICWKISSWGPYIGRLFVQIRETVGLNILLLAMLVLATILSYWVSLGNKKHRL